MATITLNIRVSKQRVMDEVAKTTAYIGSKAVSQQDPGAYERIATTDANREQLDRFWMEACDEVSRLLGHWVTQIASQALTHHPELGNDYTATLAMPTNWNSAYGNPIQELLLSMMVNSIVAKWLLITLPSQVEAYAALATSAGAQAGQLLLERKRPNPRRSGPNTDDGLWHRADVWHRAELW